MKKAEPRFNGSDYVPDQDWDRLTKQHERVRDAMKDGAWHTLEEIAKKTQDPQASISAQLRHLRKDRFGGFKIDKRSRGKRRTGLFEYRLTTPERQLTLLEGARATRKCPTCGKKLK